MTQFIIFLIIGAVGIVVGYFLALPKLRAKAGLALGRGAVGRRQAKRDANIDKLKDYLRGKEKVTNDEVEKFLGVSDSTATRYMDELESEGFVEQIGSKGRHVYYKIK